MLETFRQSMTWLHTWFGLVLGFVLMVIFFFGALSVFDREFDRWAIPETRFDPQPMPSYDELLLPIFQQMRPNNETELAFARDRAGSDDLGPMPAIEWGAYTTHRDPLLAMYSEHSIINPNDPNDHVHGQVTIDPRNGELLSQDQLRIGSDFFYRMHFSLDLPSVPGYWIIGIATLVMLAALVSGVVIHRKIFREFFTFRPWKNTQRGVLDIHNMTGVTALPFHFFFALTGLMIFINTFFPVSFTQLQLLHDKSEEIQLAAQGLPTSAAGVEAPMASVDAMVAEAKRRWAERDMPGEVGFLWVTHVNDANSYVSIYRAGSDRVAQVGEGIHFKGTTGEVLVEDPPHSAVGEIDDFLIGLHLQHFEHWFLRWLYVLGGLLGAVCIATGFIFFVEKRKAKHAETHSQGSRIVDALAVTTVTGMLIATLAILLANRVLPIELEGRDSWEKSVFWWTWLLALVHAFWRSAPVAEARHNPAWREQCWVISILAIIVVLLNWVTTGDHLIKTVFTDPYWAVAGVDLSLLASALIAFIVARKLSQPVIENVPSHREAVVYE